MMISAYTVLVADDDAGHRESIEALLHRRGLETRSADSGAGALDIVRSFRLHAVVLDVHMPELTGIETCRRMLTIVERLPCILMTGDRSHGLRAEALEAGAADLIEKPVDGHRLVTLLRELMSTRW